MKTTFALAVSLLLAAGCKTAGPLPMAVAQLASLGTSTAHGTVHFQELADGSVEVQADLMGVPAGTHGFHIHEKGDCGDYGNAAGGHFNPGASPHAAPDATAHHAGDFGNVTADASGEVHAKFVTRSITARAEGANSAVGHAVILHANPDDLTTQPSGNAGPRIACGVVRVMTGHM